MKKSTSAVKAQSRRSADSTKTRPHKQPEKIGVCVVCGSWAPCKCPKPEDPSTWPVLWRVVAPTAGSFNHDMVFTETTSNGVCGKPSGRRGTSRTGQPLRMSTIAPPACGAALSFLPLGRLVDGRTRNRTRKLAFLERPWPYRSHEVCVLTKLHGGLASRRAGSDETNPLSVMGLDEAQGLGEVRVVRHDHGAVVGIHPSVVQHV